MKYLIFTDLHGSSTSLEKIEKKYYDFHCDKIICLGDLLYHGPRNSLPDGYNPKRVVEIIKNHLNHFIWIQGNCDAEVDEMVITKKFTKKKSFCFGRHKFICTHGHHLSANEPDLSIESGSIVLYGHYHVFDIKEINGVTYINIGSPSLPKDGIPQYAILDDISIRIYNLNDDSIIGEYLL